MSIGEVLDLVRCPHCEGGFTLSERTLGCGNGHRFDVARQGYVNLLPGGTPRNADTAEMVLARERFLNAGHYTVLLRALQQAVQEEVQQGDGAHLDREPVLIDAGAGPGWYLAGLLDALPTARGLATDVAVPAIRRAARRHPRMTAVVADSWAGLPVPDGVADVVLCGFAPRNPADAARMLRPGGRWVVMAAEPDHLAGLRERLGLLGVEPGKHQRLIDSLPPGLKVIDSWRVNTMLQLPPGAVADLVAMGPNAFHHRTGREPADELVAEVSVRVTVTRRDRAGVAA